MDSLAKKEKLKLMRRRVGFFFLPFFLWFCHFLLSSRVAFDSFCSSKVGNDELEINYSEFRSEEISRKIKNI